MIVKSTRVICFNNFFFFFKIITKIFIIIWHYFYFLFIIKINNKFKFNLKLFFDDNLMNLKKIRYFKEMQMWAYIKRRNGKIRIRI